ncbi:predicted protein [Histoplasma capsulatum var. duboisii H88]|uniref:Predicted protein n=1 Tax=Ajellomyces capsulatus (strain H88) TaxID=544711 RepID=F0UCE9_AJEC8|nr:predicted protein [Histoplasma capsulatum var. duboisii H88]
MAAGTAGTGGIDTVEAIRTKCYGSLDPQIPASSSRVNSFDLKYTSTKSSSAKSELLFIRMFDSDTRKRIMTLITGMMTGSSLCDSRDNSLSWFAEGGRTWYPLTREDVNANSQSSYRWARYNIIGTTPPDLLPLLWEECMLRGVRARGKLGDEMAWE